MKWCCKVFQGWFEEAGKRGLGVFVSTRDHSDPAFILQYRALDPEAPVPQTEFPFSSVSDIHIHFVSDVLRTRILLTRIEDWEQVAIVHGQFFGSIRPANTIMQVVRFIDPDWLVEIEADAILEGQGITQGQ